MKVTQTPKDAILSAIVPVSRMAGRLGVLETWFKQAEGLPIEIIIVHDLNDEHTGDELRIILNRYTTLNTVFYEEQFGSPGAARNKALKVELKKWVSFWDSDDMPDLRNVMLAIQKADPIDEIIIGNYSINDTKKITRTYHLNDLNRVALNPGIWRMVFKSELIAHLRFDPYRMGEDQLFLVKLNLESRRVKFSEHNFYTYFRGHPNQLSSNKQARREVMMVLKEICNQFSEKSILRNNFSEIVKVRLFITLIKNLSLCESSRAKIFLLPKQYDIKLKKVFEVLKLLLRDKLSRSVFNSDKFDP